MDFTNPETMLLRLKAYDDERIFYCQQAVIKTSAVSSQDIVALDISAEDLLIFLKVVNCSGGIRKAVESLTVKEKIHLIRSVKLCGVRLGSAFDSFAVVSDVIFESFTKDPVIGWKSWLKVAKNHNLDMYNEDNAINLLCRFDEAQEEEAKEPRKRDVVNEPLRIPLKLRVFDEEAQEEEEEEAKDKINLGDLTIYCAICGMEATRRLIFSEKQDF
jgi:hypothetical protein